MTATPYRIVVTPRGSDSFHTADHDHDARILTDIIQAAVRVQYGDGAEVRQIRHHEPPSRFHATPAEINQFLRHHFAEDTLLRYQQAVGDRAVGEAVEDIRVDTNLRQLEGNYDDAKYGRELADLIDPLKGAGHWPSALIIFATEEEQ